MADQNNSQNESNPSGGARSVSNPLKGQARRDSEKPLPDQAFRILKSLDRSSLNTNNSLDNLQSLLRQLLEHNFQNPELTIPGTYIMGPANQTEFQTALTEEQISDAYYLGPTTTNRLIFVSDILSILNDTSLVLQNEIKRVGQEVKSSHQQSGTSSEAAEATIITEDILSSLENIASANRARVQGWVGGKIPLEEDLEILQISQQENFSNVTTLASSLSRLALSFESWLATYSNLLQKGVEAVVGEDDPKEVEALADAGLSESPGFEPTTQAQEDVEASSKPPLDRGDPPNPSEFNSALANFSQSFSQLVLNNILAAYSIDESGEALASFEALTPELQTALRAQLAPQIENIILSLSPDKLESLMRGGSDASAVRLEVFRKAHSFAIGYPPLRILVQQAINENYALLAENNPSKKEELAKSLVETSHEQAADNLEAITESQSDRLGEGGDQLNSILRLRRLSPEDVRLEFTSQLGGIVGVAQGDPSLSLARSNFESTITSIIVADPTLTPKFVDYLSYAQVRAFLGDVISAEQFEENKDEFRALLKQYWILLRAEINESHPSLQRMSDLSPHQASLDEDQVNDRVHQAVLVRTELLGKSGLSNNDFLSAAAGDEVVDSEDGAGVDRVAAIKQYLLQATTEEQRERYLEEVGLGDRLIVGETDPAAPDDEAVQIRRQNNVGNFTQILQEAQQEFDYFLFAAIELEHQQQQAIQAYAATTLAQGIAQQAAMSNAAAQAQALLMMQGSQFLVPGESYAQQLPGQNQATTFSYNPFSTEQALSHSQGLTKAVNQQKMQALEGLAEMGVDAALNYATGGGYGAIPKPIRDFVNKAVVKESLKRLRILGKIAKAAAIALALLIGKLAALAKTIFSTLGAAGTATAAGLAGLALLGPVGGAIGLAIGAIGGWFGGSKVVDSALSSAASESLGAGAQNARSAAEGLGSAARRQASLATKEAAAESAQAAAAEVMTSTQVASAAVVGGVFVPAVATMGIASVIIASFLLDTESRPSPLPPEPTYNPYVEIAKSASPSRIENNTPSTITYTIQITPRDGYEVLIDRESLSDSFRSFGDEVPDLPDQTDVVVSQIEQDYFSSPLSMEYSVDDVQGVDAFVINQLEFSFVARDTSSSEETTSSISTSASLIIGTPSLGCFNFASGGVRFPVNAPQVTSKAWSDREIADTLEAFARRAGTSPMFLSLLCGEGIEGSSGGLHGNPINLYRLTGTTYGGWAPDDGGASVGLYDGIMRNSLVLEYTLIHELGHIADYRSRMSLGRRFASEALINTHCFTYPFPNLCQSWFITESFAEAVALYVIYRHYSFKTWGIYNFPQRDPQEYAWIRENVFGGVEF